MELELLMILSHHAVARNGIWSSARAASVFNSRVISPAPRTNSFEMTSIVVFRQRASFESDGGIHKVTFISLFNAAGE